MLRILIILLLSIISLPIYANTISFCINEDKYLSLALDGEIFTTSGGKNCFNHDTKGISIVLFTNDFDVVYQSEKCGNADPCIIPLYLTNGRRLASFLITSRTLLTQYN